MLNANDSQSSSDSTEPEVVVMGDSFHGLTGREQPTPQTTSTEAQTISQEDPEEYSVKRSRSEMTYNSAVDPSGVRYGSGSGSTNSTLPRGLQNLGNTCFMNSALQCLCRSPMIRDYFVKNGGGDGGVSIALEGFSAKFAHLMREVNTNSVLAFAPWSFKQAISERDARFGGYEQQDAQELAIVLLDAIHEDQKRSERVKTGVPNEVDSRSEMFDEVLKGDVILGKGSLDDSKLGEWERYLEREDTIVSRNFHGLFKSVIKCGACGKESIAYDPFASLSLSISSPPKETFKVFRTSGDALVQGVTKTSEDWLFKDGIYYEPLPNSAFYSFYAECDRFAADAFIDLGNGEFMNVCKVSKPLLLPTSTPLEFLRARLGAVYPDVELGWSEELVVVLRENKFVFGEDLMKKLSPDGDALDDIKEFFETLFKESSAEEEFEHQQGTSLGECLDAFEKAESLAPNTWYCPNCKSRPDSASKQMSLHVLPSLLLIQLKRFEFNSWGGSRKLTRPVTYPGILEIGNQSFELYGVVEHFGGLFSGHYTARVKCEGDKWYNFDDSYVSPVSGAVNSRNAYLLFYSRSTSESHQ